MFSLKLQQKIACILILSFSSLSFAHSGRTDSSGCHNDNIHGGYHCHNDGSGSGSSSSGSKGVGAVVVGVLVAALVYYYRDHFKNWFHQADSRNKDYSGSMWKSNHKSTETPVATQSGFSESRPVYALGPDRDTLFNEYKKYISSVSSSSFSLDQSIDFEKESCEKTSLEYQCMVKINGLKKMVILSDMSGQLVVTGTRSFE